LLVFDIRNGGLQAAILAAVDCRVAVAAPMMGVVNLEWGLRHDTWQDTLTSTRTTAYLDLALPSKHNQNRALENLVQQIQKDRRNQDPAAPEMSADLTRQIWKKLAPGLLEGMDAPFQLAMCAPRPVIIITGV
jgi:hypothetical protein